MFIGIHNDHSQGEAAQGLKKDLNLVNSSTLCVLSSKKKNPIQLRLARPNPAAEMGIPCPILFEEGHTWNVW